jgi:uncharacterized delta-60 repeat protein
MHLPSKFLRIAVILLSGFAASLQAASISTINVLVGPTVGTDSVLLKRDFDGSWSATANAAWLSLPASSASSAIVNFAFTANTGATRSGTLTITHNSASFTVTVTQLGSDYVQATQVGTLVSGGISNPRGMAVNAAGDAFFLDPGTSELKRWAAATNTVSTLVTGVASPGDVVTDSSGNVFFVQNSPFWEVKKWDAGTNAVTSFVASPGPIVGLAMGPSNILHVAIGGFVQKFDSMGISQGYANFSSLGTIRGIAVDFTGDVYYTLATSPSTFRKLNILAGTQGTTNLSSVNLANPLGLAVDLNGNVFLGNNTGNNTTSALIQWRPSTNTGTRLIGSGALLDRPVYDPRSVATNAAGSIYAVGAIDEIIMLPRAFVKTGNVSVPLTAGSSSLPAVMPTTTLLKAPFTPTSDVAWITITGSSAGVVSFTHTASGSARYGYITVLGQKVLVQQGTPSAPSVTVNAATSVTAITATLNGTVSSEGGAPMIARGFRYRTGANPFTEVAISLTGAFTLPITGLQPGTTYDMQAYATNSTGATTSSTFTFTTVAATPAVFATPTSSDLNVVAGSIALNGNITSEGNTPVTSRGVVYAITGLNSNPTVNGSYSTSVADTGTGAGAFSRTINGLFPGTQYSFRTWAVNLSGTTYSSSVTFTMPPPTYKLGADTLIRDASGDHESIVLAVTPPSAQWVAQSNDAWITLNAESGTGSALLSFYVDANFGATRTGTVTIAGQTLTVTQAAAGYAPVDRATQLGTTFAAFNAGVAVDTSGNVYATPFTLSTDASLMRWSPATNAWTQLASTLADSTSYLAVAPAGSVFFSTRYTGGFFRRLDKWTPPSGPVSAVYPNAGTPGIAGFYSSRVAADSQGNIWLIDGSVKRYNPTTNVMTSMFNSPANWVIGEIALDAADNVYASLRDYYYSSYQVVKWDAVTGAMTTLIHPGALSSYASLAVDGSGNIYLTQNSGSPTLVKWTAVTNTLSTVLTGIQSTVQIAVDRAGSVYLTQNGTTTVESSIIQLPRVFVPSRANVGLAAGSGTLPVTIPAGAINLPPFAPTSETAWLTIDSNTAGSVGYSWSALAIGARYGYINVAGRRVLVQQGTPGLPTLAAPTAVSQSSNLVMTGNITSDGGGPLNGRGFVIARTADNANPQIGGAAVTVVMDTTVGTGSFTGTGTGLSPNTSYTFVAYAINNTGTAYSTPVTVVTNAYDATFSVYSDRPGGTAAQMPDGRFVIFNGGYLLRNNADGSPDYSLYVPFDPGSTVNSILALDDGGILIGGSFTDLLDSGANNLMKLAADGSPAPFASNVNGVIRCMALQRDGSILIGGDFTQVNGQARNRIARIYANGTLDLTFNPNANGPVRSIAEQPDARLVLGGDFTLIGTTLCNRLARISTLGVVDATFTTNTDAAVNAVAVQPDGHILIGGSFSTINNISRARLARLNANGTLDNEFTTTANDAVNSIALQADGRLLIGGGFTRIHGISRLGFARLLADGSVDGFNADVMGIDINTSLPKTGIVNSITVLEDGKIIIAGDISKVGGADVGYVARLLNDPITQTLEPTGSNGVEWLRGGSLPEAVEVAFDISTDGGTTWTLLGKGVRSEGGWTWRSTTTLPASAQLRGRARTVGGFNNGSGGWNYHEAPYTLAAQEIVVEQPVNSDLSSGDMIDLGTLGQGVSVLTTFTVRNSGGFSLTGLNATISGTHAAMFTVTRQPATSLDSLDSTTFVVQAKLTSAGAKTATINLVSNDADESPFVILLTATGAAAVPPVVTTTNATDISFTTATANGTVDAKGSLREVFIDYGLTTSYGNSVSATPATITTSGNVSADLTGLLPHKTYNYRVRADGDLGNAPGANKTFTTLNNAPVGTNDTAIIQPGAVGSIDVLANDTDADADLLTISAKTTVTPIAAGTVTITANQLVFTASAAFSGTATFGYTLSDGFGGSATASVTVSTGSITIDPLTASYPSAAVTYPIEITANGAWAVSESLAWASVSQSRGTGKTIIQVTLQPNATVIARPGTIKIGSATHTITQAGVVTPVIGPLSGTYDTIVGESVALTIPTQNAPVTYTVTGTMPPGLALDQATGIISGTPTKDGNYPLSVKAKNLAGNAAATLSFTIAVAKLPSGVVGTFHGYVERSATARFSAEPNLGARFEMTTTINGGVSGNVVEGVTKKSFTAGKLVSNFATPNTPAFTAALTGTNMFIDISFDAVNNTATGILRNSSGQSSAAITAWRNGWSSVLPIVKASDYKAQHTFSLQNTNNTNGPQGYGFGSFIVTEATGVLNITGSLPDGSPLLCSTFVGQKGEVLLYQALHANRGSCFGKLEIVKVNAPADNTLSGNLTWLKPASLPAAKDLVYSSGFGALPLSLTAVGGTLSAPLKGQRLLGVPNAADNASLVFGSTSASPAFNQLLRIINPNNTTGTTNTATISLPNINIVTLPTLTFATGDFKGSFILPGTSLATNRTAPFVGQLVRTGGTIQGYGYYLMPTGTPTTTSTKVSGSVELKTP